jgi:hypothetical protein
MIRFPPGTRGAIRIKSSKNMDFIEFPFSGNGFEQNHP